MDDERLGLGLDPDELQPINRELNDKGRVSATYSGGGIFVDVSVGGFEPDEVKGAVLRVYRTGANPTDRTLITEFRTESEPGLARVINIVNHVLNKRQLKTYNLKIDLSVEATSEAEAREAIKNIVFFSNREALVDWEIKEIAEE
jgi:hypothetical protein